MSEQQAATTTLPVPAAKIAEVEAVVQSCGLQALEKFGAFERTFTLAAGVQRLRTLITQEMMRDVMALQGSALGFLTDKDRSEDGSPGPGYPVAVVKECMIEAVLRGLHTTGNEFNIISARQYTTKNGFARLVREFPGLTNLEKTFSVPVRVGDDGAKVTVSATWKLKGQPQELKAREIPIRVNKRMGADAVLGKADRKLLAAIYSQLTGSEQNDGEVGDDVVLDGARNITPTDTPLATGSRSEQLAGKLKADKPTGGSQPPATETPPQGADPEADAERAAIQAADETCCADIPSGKHTPGCPKAPQTAATGQKRRSLFDK